MRRLVVVGAACAMLCLTGCSSDKNDGKGGSGDGAQRGTTDQNRDDEKKESSDKPKKEPTTAEKLIGTWELTKGQVDPGSTVEFTADGKIKAIARQSGQIEVTEGTYSVEGQTIKSTIEGKNETTKIITLTDSQLITEDEARKIDEFKKK
jgi:uncharacterized protein (TIGR03066 family)